MCVGGGGNWEFDVYEWCDGDVGGFVDVVYVSVDIGGELGGGVGGRGGGIGVGRRYRGGGWDEYLIVVFCGGGVEFVCVGVFVCED